MGAVTVGADGNRTKTYFVDSSNIPSYVFLKGSAKVNDDLTLGAHLEYAVHWFDLRVTLYMHEAK